MSHFMINFVTFIRKICHFSKFYLRVFCENNRYTRNSMIILLFLIRTSISINMVPIPENDPILATMKCTTFISNFTTLYYSFDITPADNLCIQVNGGAVVKGTQFQLAYYDEIHGLSDFQPAFSVFFGDTSKNVVRIISTQQQTIAIYNIVPTFSNNLNVYMSSKPKFFENVLQETNSIIFVHFSDYSSISYSVDTSPSVIAQYNGRFITDGFSTTSPYFISYLQGAVLTSGLGKTLKVDINSNAQPWPNQFDGFFVTKLPQMLEVSSLSEFGISYWIYIIIFIAAIVIITVIVTIIVICLKKKRVHQQNEEEEELAEQNRRNINYQQYLPDNLAANFQPGFPAQEINAPDETKNEMFVKYPEPEPVKADASDKEDENVPNVNPYQ